MKTFPETVTAEEMAVIEQNTEYLGVSMGQLMECAGRAVAEKVAEKASELGEKEITIFVGTGRNGGDGMVAARHLSAKGFKVQVYLIGVEEKIMDENVKRNWKILKKLKNTVKTFVVTDSTNIPQPSTKIIVDAMLGTGAKGKLRQPILQAVQILNKRDCFRVSVDVPTGLDASTGEIMGEVVKANLTITFHKPKTGLVKTKENVGEIFVADIGIPPEAELYTGPGDVKKILKPRPPTAHKGDFGRLLIVGGSETFTGAPALAGLTALRVGVDLVWIAAPTQTAQTIATYSPNLITLKLKGKHFNLENLDELKPYLERATTVLVGPGLGVEEETFKAVQKLVEEVEKLGLPLLLDADGLKAYSQNLRKTETPMVLTPHQAEYTMLTGEKLPENLEEKAEKVRVTAKKLGCTILLKGWVDVISDGVKVKLNWTGNPGMTVGGTGDVLAGLVAGFLAQGTKPMDAAVAAAFLNGAAGDLAVKKKGYHIVPTDLLEEIPNLIQNPLKHKELILE